MFRIKQLAERTGLSPSRIRYYERIGLLRPVERLPNGYRVYPAEAEPVLRLIVLAQEAGFSLEEMQRLLPPRLAGWDYDLLTAALQRKLDAIAAAEAQLAASKARLIAVMAGIKARPEGIGCAANAERLLTLAQLAPRAAD